MAYPKAVPGLALETVDADVIVHDPVHARVHVVNRTAAAVLQLCDGTRAPEQIADELAALTGAARERILRDLGPTLMTFADLQLVS